MAVSLVVLCLLFLALARPGSGASQSSAGSAGNYGPSPPQIHPIAGSLVSVIIALLIVLVLLLGLFFARRRNGNGGNGNGREAPSGVAETTTAKDVFAGQSEEVSAPDATGGPTPEGPSGESPDDSLDETIDELNSLSVGPPENPPDGENGT